MMPAATPSIDVIVLTNSSNVTWLDAFKPHLSGLGIIFAYRGSGSFAAPNSFPGAVVVTAAEAAAAKLSVRDAAVLKSTKQHVLFLQEGVGIAKTPEGHEVNIVEQHLVNLSTPATPVFFNTLYDPFRKGTDFVRGYPFSWRDGVPTALSHGLWLGSGQRYVDATLTVPKEAYAVFAPVNLAVNKQLLGIALHSGVEEDGSPAKVDNDNTWTSLVIKTIANHLSLGCKTGLPYVTSSSTASSAAAPAAAPRLQKEVLSFFQGVKLSASSTTAEQAYTELAGLVRQQLGGVDSYFVSVADSMDAWAQAYKAAAGTQ